MDPTKFGGGSAPMTFDMGGGGQVSFSMDTAPMMPGADASVSAPGAMMFTMDGGGAATEPAGAAAEPAAPKARAMTGRVVVSLAGIAGDAGFAKARSAAAGAAALDPDAFADPIVTEVADAAALAGWWAGNKGEAPGADADIGEATCAAAIADAPSASSSSSAPDGPGAVAVGTDAVIAFVRGRIGGGGALRQPTVTHAAAGEGTFDYDFLVIGGGSGGLACAKEAAKLGARVCLCDFVTPSPAGTRWGLGGTCVNVGCIPKKLMHRAAVLREDAKDMPFFGWEAAGGEPGPGGEPAAPSVGLRWPQLVSNVQDHIASLNYGYKGELGDHAITYRNAKASLTGVAHEVSLTDKQGKTSTVTAGRIVVAVGGRPRALGCPGAELAISSDDIFQLATPPGRTLIVGAGYIALETAGFLAGLGFPVTVMVRSILLRGFDRECVVMIEKDLVKRGVTILPRSTPVRIEEVAPADGGAASASGSPAGPRPRRVTWTQEDGSEASAEFDTVFAAIGRSPDTASLGLDAAGVATARSGKVVCTDEQTSVPHVFAIGDVVEGKPELTPVAIQAGRLLARRLFGGSAVGFDYRCVATTVFTPLEYGVIGMSEEEASAELGADNVDAYLSKYKPLEWTLNYYREESAFAKVVVDLRDDRVVGLHYLGPNAGEVTQGFAAAMRMGLTFTALRDTVGIHPTVAEEFTMLEVSRSSGAPIEKGSC